MTTETNTQSENIGQVARARCESESSCINENQTKEKSPQSSRENARYAAARRSAEREYKAELARLREQTEREIERRVAQALAGDKTAQSKSEGEGALGSLSEVGASSEADGGQSTAEHESPTTDITAEGARVLDEGARVHDEGARVHDEGARVHEIAERLSDERARLALDREIEKVSRRFPEVKNVLDIVRLERYGEVKRMVERGYALSDAMRLVYEDVYVRRQADAAAREARGTPSSSHIRATSPTSATSHEISEQQIRTYLSSVPGATREGAIRAYQKYKIGKK